MLIVAGCTTQNINTGYLMTSDDISISYQYNKIDSDKAVLLLHMLSGNKDDWKGLPNILNKKFSTLAIDLRGHGSSGLNWEDFSEDDFKNMLLDVDEAKNFLEYEGYKEIYIVGASIGANLAVNSYDKTFVKKVVLLSPGISYRNIVFEEKNLDSNVLIVSSKDDIKSYKFSRNLPKAKLLEFDSGGHGTDLLFNHPELNSKIFEFLIN